MRKFIFDQSIYSDRKKYSISVDLLGVYLSVHRCILARSSNLKGIKSSTSLKFRRTEAFCFLGDAGPRDLDPRGMQPGEKKAINFDKSSPSLFLRKYSTEQNVVLVLG